MVTWCRHVVVVQGGGHSICLIFIGGLGAKQEGGGMKHNVCRFLLKLHNITDNSVYLICVSKCFL